MQFAWDGCSMFGCLCWGSSDAFGPAFLGLHVWELCFSLVSLLWESCYSLPFGYGMHSEGAVHLLRCTLCFSLYLLPPPFYLSSPLFFPPFYLSSPLFFSPFFLLPQLSHLLLLFLSFSFVPLFFFEGIACTERFSRCNRGHH